MLAVLAVTLFCSQSSEIVSDRFLATLGRAFAGKPMVTYRKKSWTHPTGKGDPWLYSTSSDKEPRPNRCSPFSNWPLHRPRGSFTLGPPLLVTRGTQVQTVCLCSLGHPQPFTMCSITTSNCDLTVPLQTHFLKAERAAWSAICKGLLSENSKVGILSKSYDTRKTAMLWIYCRVILSIRCLLISLD